MKIIKIIDFILLLATSAIGVIHEIYPPIIPNWLFNTMWIVGPVSIITLGIILFLEERKKEII
ncbi:MAG: hypothetical protein IJY56_04825 [Clostridia bacterium]|nr:hypothetical protein [Clostridia bacterium]